MVACNNLLSFVHIVRHIQTYHYVCKSFCGHVNFKLNTQKFLLLLQTRTCASLFDTNALPGKANSFSTPPVSFQCISFFVGGARSRVVTMSVVSESCNFIVSLAIAFCSSITSFRFFFTFLSVPTFHVLTM